MTLDLLIPFLILISLVIYLIYTRNKFEKDILKIYEKKYEEWKKSTTFENKDKKSKELVGLVFREDSKIFVELFDKSVESRLQKAKFDTKYIGNIDE